MGLCVVGWIWRSEMVCSYWSIGISHSQLAGLHVSHAEGYICHVTGWPIVWVSDP